MKYLKTFESENNSNRRYLDVNAGFCPVCNTEGKEMDKEEFSEYEGEYTFKCPLCDFWWKQEFELIVDDLYRVTDEIYNDEITDFNGDTIEAGLHIDDKLYDEMKLQVNKYNL